MKFFEGFEWAVPTAFAPALAGCQFSEGDIFYDRRDAYLKPWKGNDGNEVRWVQVISPPRPTVLSGGAGQQAFEKSWGQPLLLDISDSKTGYVQTTQGALYTFLWRGNENVLRSCPPVPGQAQSLMRALPEAAVAFRRTHAEQMTAGLAFLLLVDQAVELQTLKARAVRAAMRVGHGARETRTPAAQALRHYWVWLIRPTVDIYCFAAPTADEGELRARLKSCLYEPAKNKKSSVDRFNLSRHGHLFSVGDA